MGRLLAEMAAISFLALALHGCSTTEVLDARIETRSVPHVVPIAVIERLDEQAAVAYKEGRAVVDLCVMDGEVYDLLWESELQLDQVVLRPAAGSSFEVVKVGRIGHRRIRVAEGTRNNRPFKSVTVIDE